MKLLLALLAVFALFCATANAVDKSVCYLPKEIGPCRKSDESFYYDSSIGKCEKFLYGGCHGNANRFSTQEDCEATCK